MIIDQAKLKDLLKKKGLTKSALCAEIGISSRTIAKIGKGRPELLQKSAKAKTSTIRS